jgi:adenylate kinase
LSAAHDLGFTCPVASVHSLPFPTFGVPAKVRFLVLGSTDQTAEALLNWTRSLNLEHVSPARLPRPEISRRLSSRAAAADLTILAQLRRWFFARKPDAGFVLTDCPATLLQALVFDEWLDARDETLHGVLVGPGADDHVVAHYRTLGLLRETGTLAA